MLMITGTVKLFHLVYFLTGSMKRNNTYKTLIRQKFHSESRNKRFHLNHVTASGI